MGETRRADLSDDTQAGLTRIEGELVRMLRRVRRRVAYRAASVDPRLHAPAYAVLIALHERTGEGVRASELVHDLGMDKGMISRQLTALEDLALVARTHDPQDGRAHRIELTDLGRERVAKVAAESRERFAERLTSWSPERLHRFADELRDYNAAFEDDA